ncbi:Uncharacterized protein EbC_32350 [Erwinia billingiae Eb661]|uniref:Uncharacterized protein n=1 Tax=Erwinia billingiae (strain Eb661) TaxID=634500 RepID=D8MVA9_ERWBE|nr:Uncharacterized protein EbC_32350 [Erwinia billingiae Eb661]
MQFQSKNIVQAGLWAHPNPSHPAFDSADVPLPAVIIN